MATLAIVRNMLTPFGRALFGKSKFASGGAAPGSAPTYFILGF